MFQQDEHRARTDLGALLEDTSVSRRTKAIVLYFVENFPHLCGGPASVALFERMLCQLHADILAIAEDIESEIEHGRDPFEVVNFPYD